MAQNFPNSPTVGQKFGSWVWDGTKWVAAPDTGEPINLVFNFVGKPISSAMLVLPVTFDIHIPTALAGSKGLIGGAAPASSASFVLNKISGISSTVIGSIIVSNIKVFNFSGIGGDLVAGDALTMTAPPVQDATMSDPAIAIAATRV